MTFSAIASRRNLSWLARRTAASISRRNPSIVSIVSTSMWFVGSARRRTSLYVPHAGLRRDVRDLREVAVPEPGLEHEVPQVRRRLAREEPEQGALPRAVRADEGDLVPRLEEEVGVLEDERGAPGFPEVPARDDRLHVPGV